MASFRVAGSWPREKEGVRHRVRRKATGSGKNKLVTKKRITHQCASILCPREPSVRNRKSQIENLAREVPGEVKQIVLDHGFNWPVLR